MTDHAPSLFHRLQHTPLRDAFRGRLTARLDLERVYSQSTAPQAAIECVRRVVRKARLWRSERVEVAEELLAHFVDGQDAGTSTDELLERFGDERRAAKLIRRAKRRQRPRVWHAWRMTGWCTAALLVWYVGLWAYYWSGTPTPTVDYLAQINARAAAVPEDQRAWPVYLDAWEELKTIRKEVWRGAPPGFQDWPTPDHAYWPVLERWLLDHQKTIAKLRNASTLPALGAPVSLGLPPSSSSPPTNHPDPGVQEVLPPMLADESPPTPIPALYLYADILIHDATRAMNIGDCDTFLEDIFAVQRMVEQADPYRDMRGPMIMLVQMSSVYDRVAKLLEDDPAMLSNAQWRDVAHELSRFDAADIVRAALERERAYVLDGIQRTYTDRGDGDGKITLSGTMLLLEDYRMNRGSHVSLREFQVDERRTGAAILQIVSIPFVLVRTASREEIVAKTNQLFGSYQAMLTSPPWNNRRFTEESLWGHKNILRDKCAFSPYWPLEILFRPTASNQHFAERMNAKQDPSLIAIALELYHRDHSKWPAALADLTPSYLPTIPPDPMTGEPLKYRLHEGQPIIYGVGTDGDNDMGRAPIVTAGEDYFDIDDAPATMVVPGIKWPWLGDTWMSLEGDLVLWPMFDVPLIEKTDE